MKDKKALIDTQIDEIAESQEIPVKEAAKQYVKRSDFVFSFDNMQPQLHRWIDRGMKMTCESAGHPYHEAWKR